MDVRWLWATRRCSGDANRRVFPAGCTPKPAVDNGAAIAIGKLVIRRLTCIAARARGSIAGDRACGDRQLEQPGIRAGRDAAHIADADPVAACR